MKNDFDAIFSGNIELSIEYSNSILEHFVFCDSIEEWYDFAAMFMGMSV